MKAHVVTRLSDGSQFAYSGQGNIETDKAALTDRLVRASPVMVALQERFPTRFAAFLDDYQAGITKGKTRQEMKVMLRGKFMPFIEAIIPLADDDVVLEYSRLVVDQYVALSSTNASHCYTYASSDRADLSFMDELPDDAREADLHERAIRTATRREAVNEATKSALSKQVIDRLLAAGVPSADIALMAQRKVEPINHARYCAAAIKFFREALQLPKRDAAALMRNVLKQR